MPRRGRSSRTARYVTFRGDAPARPGMDGLGDRDRSLSPDHGVWDTLLSTLTPDPQPPSVGSSFTSAATASAFASAAPSQGVTGSSNTSLTVPEVDDEIMGGEQFCESGCEHSESDEDNDDETGLTSHPIGNSVLQSMRPRSVPDYNLDGTADMDLSAPDASMRHPSRRDAPSPERTFDPRRPRLMRRSVGEGWLDGVNASRSSVRGNPVPGQAVAETTISSSNNNPVEDDPWGGMQRIVRNLARREDIPDEWWAEAGLSRTLPQESPNQ